MNIYFVISKLKNFSVYAIVSFLSMGLSFIFMPLITTYLSPSDYGLIRLFNTYTSFLIPIIGLGAFSFLRVAVHKLKKNELQALFSSQLYWTILTFPVLFIVFYFSLSLLKKDAFSLTNVFQIGLLSLISAINSSYIIFLIQRKQVKQYAATMTVKIVVETFFTVSLIAIYKIGWEGRIYSWIISEVIVLIFGLVYFYKNDLLTLSINFSLLKRSILFGSPLIIHGIGRIIIDQSDLIFIEKYTSLKDVGLYSIGYQFGNLVSIACVIFQHIYTPYFFEKMKSNHININWNSMKTNYAILSISIILALSLHFSSPLIFQWFNSDYSEGLDYIIWIAISFVMYNGYQMFSLYFHYHEDTKYLSVFTLMALITNIILNYYLIAKFNALGAAYATLITYTLYFIITAIVAIKKYNLPLLKKYKK